VSVTAQADISALLKENYRPVFVDTIYQDTMLFDLLKKYSGDVRGSSVNHAVELTRSHGGGGRGAGAFLPVDYPESFKQSSVTLNRWYWTISVDGFAVEMFKKGDGSFADYLDLRMKNAVRDATNQLNRISHGDGSGVLAKINATGTIAAGSAVTISHVNGYSFGACQFLEEGDSIAILNSTGTTVKATTRISKASGGAIDWDNQQIYLADTVSGLAVGDLIVLGDAFGNSYNAEANGLRGIIKNTGTVQGISCDDYNRWKSIIVDKTAAPVPYDWTHVTRLVSGSMYKGSSSPANLVLLMHPAMIEEHQRLVDPDLRYAPTDFQLNKGLEVPVFSVLGKQIPVRDSVHMGYQEIVCLNTDELERFELSPMDWDDTDGAIVKNLQGKDAVYAFLKYYWAIAAKSLNHFARMDGIQVDTDYVSVIHKTM
tara:strand:+ start:7141 stop:8424 length:1284 start_codon:yes stop_codon:yes gene_type:complete